MDSICSATSRRVSKARTMAPGNRQSRWRPDRHTGTDDQHLGGRNFTGGGDLTGEEATELVRGFTTAR